VHTVTGHTRCDVLTVPRASQLWSRSMVLGTDGSSHSERATAVAAALAVRHGLPLTVVSVAEHHLGHAPDASAADANVERALAVARATGARATGRVVHEGKPYQAILAAAADTDADLIVIGRRGLGRVERMLVGSTSERVAGSAGGPVLRLSSRSSRGAPDAGCEVSAPRTRRARARPGVANHPGDPAGAQVLRRTNSLSRFRFRSCLGVRRLRRPRKGFAPARSSIRKGVP
jgi:nucleotide-binding universal stress UspA family protein